MRDAAGMGRHAPRRAATIVSVGLVALVGVGLATLPLTPAGAYDVYSVDGAGNCAECHGDFRASGYVSLSDNSAWNTSLHDGHRQTMLNGDCSTCHFPVRTPVRLNSSAGGTGLDPISCAGCHGRAEPGSGGAVTGAGLRQHHFRSGVAVCATPGCHTDADPAGFTVAGESVKPPYYFTPDAAHPNKPADPCDTDGLESLTPPHGLDNDGDLLYDATDPDCTPVGVGDTPRPMTLLLEGASPNPARALVRITFTLPSEAPASLELFDAAGHRLARRDVGALGLGRHSVELASGRALRAGVYLVRLTQRGVSLSAKAVVTQ